MAPHDGQDTDDQLGRLLTELIELRPVAPSWSAISQWASKYRPYIRREFPEDVHQFDALAKSPSWHRLHPLQIPDMDGYAEIRRKNIERNKSHAQLAHNRLVAFIEGLRLLGRTPSSNSGRAQSPVANPTFSRTLMERAIELSKKCPEEKGGKPNPKVAAIVERDGKILGEAYRGQFAPGQHAEFTLLEKMLPNVELSGATLYTTLEPCTQRGEGKVPCANRILERGIRRVFIGMVDPNPDISGGGFDLLSTHNVEVSLFDSDLNPRLQELNRDFGRQHRGVKVARPPKPAADPAQQIEEERRKRREHEEAQKEEVRKQRPQFAEFQKQVRDLLSAKDVRAWVPMFEYRKALDEYIGRDDGESVSFFSDARNCFLRGKTSDEFDVKRLKKSFGMRCFYAPDVLAAREIGAQTDAYFAEYHYEGTAYLAKRQLTMDLLKFVGEVAQDLNDRMG